MPDVWHYSWMGRLYITRKFNSHNTTSLCTEHRLLQWALPITMATLSKPQGVHILPPRGNAYPDPHIYTIPCTWTGPSPLLIFLLHLFNPQGIPFPLLLVTNFFFFSTFFFVAYYVVIKYIFVRLLTTCMRLWGATWISVPNPCEWAVNAYATTHHNV